MSAGTDMPEDDIALAGEYVLRVLSPADEAAFEARLAKEPALRRIVAQWEDDLAKLAADDIAPVPAPAHIRRAIDARLFPAAPEKVDRPRWGLLGGLVAALSLALAVVFTMVPPAPGPVFVAQIAAEDNSLVVSARFEAQAGTLMVTRVAGGPRPGRVLELWLIAEGAPAPVSLGVLADGDQTVSLTPDLAASLAGGVLAISDEPPGGSPTGAPTGDVLALGPVVSL